MAKYVVKIRSVLPAKALAQVPRSARLSDRSWSEPAETGWAQPAPR